MTRSGPATALVDGDNAMGHLVMDRASQTAVELARESGVAWVGTRNANHAGCAGIYAEIPMRAGMIGIMSAVANANHMPVWGGAELLLGTKEGITKLRGKSYPFRTGVLIPTFHPAAVLRGGGEPLAQMRADFIRAKKALAQ